MTIATTKGLLQTLNAGITGLSSAQCPVNWPQSPAAMDALTKPLCLVKKAGGFSKKLAGKVYSENEWEIRLFITEEHQDNYTQALNDADTYEQRFIDKYAIPANFVLSYTPTIIEVKSFQDNTIRHTGLITHSDFLGIGRGWYGFTLRIIVTEQEI